MIRTCLPGHTGFIHINALRGGHTDTHTADKAISKSASIAAIMGEIQSFQYISNGEVL